MWMRWRGWQVTVYVGEALAGVALLALLFEGHWHGAIILTLALGGSLAFTFWREPLPYVFTLIFVVAVLANAAGYIWDLWTRIAPYDELVHGFTIFALTLAFALLVARALPDALDRHRLLIGLLIAGSGIAVGALWEVAEWILDTIPGLSIINPYVDTIVDLIMDTIGAGLAAAAGLWTAHVLSQHGALRNQFHGAQLDQSRDVA